jgi:hypothetical protein
MSARKQKISPLLWPVVLPWRLLAFIVRLVGRLVVVVVGTVLVMAGLIASLTVVGAVVGLPLILFGGLLIVRGLF